jgi:hypothetical protein
MSETNQPIKQIAFSHRDYFKFRQPAFTTCRSRSYVKKQGLKAGDLVEVTCKADVLGIAQISSITENRIGDLSAEFCDADASRPGRKVSSVQDFLRLLNRWWRGRAHPDTVLQVLHLHWENQDVGTNG